MGEMDTFLQWWGGIFYLLSKILIVRAEFQEKDRNVRLIGWLAFLLGWPAWVFLFASKQNWIATASETASIPSVIFGIVLTWKQNYNPNKYVDWSIKIFNGIVISLGVIFSIYTFNGIKTFSQFLEILIICSFLLGNYLLAKRNPFAWLVFMAAIASVGTLMFTQNRPLMFAQQIISFMVAGVGFVKCLWKAKKINAA